MADAVEDNADTANLTPSSSGSKVAQKRRSFTIETKRDAVNYAATHSVEAAARRFKVDPKRMLCCQDCCLYSDYGTIRGRPHRVQKNAASPYLRISIKEVKWIV